MDWQTWGPLIGVVLGAVLGGGAQIVDSHLSGRRERKVSQREIRRRVYVEFIRACTQVNHDAIAARNPDAGAGRTIADMVGSLSALQSARSELSLVAPEDTERAGGVLHDLHFKIASKDSSELRTKAAVARDLFIVYAQRDLGFGKGFRRPTLKELLRDWRKKRKKTVHQGQSTESGS